MDMDIIEEEIKKKYNLDIYVALGSFDGLHLGHMKLIDKAIKLAKENSGKSMVYTFKNHPLGVINENLAPKLLMDNSTKIEVLKNKGVDILRFICFDKNFMEISPKDFILNIIKQYNIKGIVVGFNFRFGHKNSGDVELLKELSKKYDFQLFIVDPVEYNDEVVSSSRIRKTISEYGNVEEAKEMLPHPYFLEGNVIKGRQIGRKMGFPTINLDYNKNFVIPKNGVYFAVVLYNNKFYKGITNIGYNPTVKSKKLNIETHVLNFNEEIYGEKIRLYFLSRLRDEKKFKSLEELSLTIKKDKGYVNKQSLDLIVKNNLQI
ncbi:bifunctional riboflavin kinase/FAD synthetase [Clostridium tetani]|uniref:Riboflavin biosynthesis protein n=2 Tax=Clostridium tetani TaxID=1513 RepID=A0ABY0EPR0_CLOTA|nr:bifunctional riboflavin kinase/FAD synthetase [Clostridium tetani]RXI74006.1 bifunctional riboflavin kinase/FAD synthetase [Clostridium tetani]